MSTPTSGPPSSDDLRSKDDWRRHCTQTRRARSAQDLAAARQTTVDHVLQLWGGDSVVCLYAPLPREPLAGDAPEQLADTGCTVLVPITDTDRPLDWVALPTDWEPGPFGIRTPIGPRLGPAAIRGADAVLVPAFAVDRHGYRMGRGGGYYDRTLALLDDPGRVTALVFDDELVDELPRDDHDRPVSAVLRPVGGLLRL